MMVFYLKGKFIIKKGSTGLWHFTLKAGNGEPILASEHYTTKAACEKGIDSVKVNAKDNNKYDRKTSSNGKYYFILKAGNGEPIGNSQMYGTEAACNVGIESVKSNAPTASVVEE